MIRRIVKIDEEKCTGCGRCANACHEGAIAMIDGKAKLIRDDYCDGLGDCLPACPADAISFELREAVPYDEEAVKEHKKSGRTLMNWPTQIKLAPPRAPYFDNASLLIAADCTAFAYAGIHKEFIKGRVVLNGCPKLDMIDYSEKLKQIFALNDISDITVLRMEVPCCGGLEMAVKRAIAGSGKRIPLKVITVSTDGKLL